MLAMPNVLLLPPLMLALLVFAAPIEDGESWRVDQLTRKGPQKTLMVERDGDAIEATVAGDEDELFARMSLDDPEKGRFTLRAGGSDQTEKVELAGLIRDFDADGLRSAQDVVIALRNGEKARLYRSGQTIYLTAPGQGVTFAARKVN